MSYNKHLETLCLRKLSKIVFSTTLMDTNSVRLYKRERNANERGKKKWWKAITSFLYFTQVTFNFCKSGKG